MWPGVLGSAFFRRVLVEEKSTSWRHREGAEEDPQQACTAKEEYNTTKSHELPGGRALADDFHVFRR